MESNSKDNIVSQIVELKRPQNKYQIQTQALTNAEVMIDDKVSLIEKVFNCYFLTGSTFKVASALHMTQAEVEKIIAENIHDEVANKARAEAIQNMYNTQIPINQALQKSIIKKINSDMKDPKKLANIKISDLITAQKNSFQLLAFMKQAQNVLEGKTIEQIPLDTTNDLINKLEDFT